MSSLTRGPLFRTVRWPTFSALGSFTFHTWTGNRCTETQETYKTPPISLLPFLNSKPIVNVTSSIFGSHSVREMDTLPLLLLLVSTGQMRGVRRSSYCIVWCNLWSFTVKISVWFLSDNNSARRGVDLNTRWTHFSAVESKKHGEWCNICVLLQSHPKHPQQSNIFRNREMCSQVDSKRNQLSLLCKFYNRLTSYLYFLLKVKVLSLS